MLDSGFMLDSGLTVVLSTFYLACCVKVAPLVRYMGAAKLLAAVVVAGALLLAMLPVGAAP
jgi:hypothetical protein